MPQRYNTGNSRPSNSMKDLNDNALAFDDYINSESDTFIDRLGATRRTRFKMDLDYDNQMAVHESVFELAQADKEDRFQGFLNSSGYVFLGNYENGPFQFSARNQYIRYNNQYYRLNAATDVGFITSGTTAASFANDVTHFVLMEGDTLRQNLGSSEGLGLVGQCSSLADLRGVEFLSTGQQIFLREHTVGQGMGGGIWYCHSLTSDSGYVDDNGCQIITNAGQVLRRKDVHNLYSDMFGLGPGGDFDSVIQNMFKASRTFNIEEAWITHAGRANPKYRSLGGNVFDLSDGMSFYIRCVGLGRFGATIVHAGNSKCIRFIRNRLTGLEFWVSGGVEGVRIVGQGDSFTGTNHYSGATAIEVSDLWGATLKSIFISGYTGNTGGAAISLYNDTGWTEGTIMEDIVVRQSVNGLWMHRNTAAGNTATDSFFKTQANLDINAGVSGTNINFIRLGDGTSAGKCLLYGHEIKLTGWMSNGSWHNGILVTDYSSCINGLIHFNFDGYGLSSSATSEVLHLIRLGGTNAIFDCDVKNTSGQSDGYGLSMLTLIMNTCLYLDDPNVFNGTVSRGRPIVRAKGMCIKFSGTFTQTECIAGATYSLSALLPGTKFRIRLTSRQENSQYQLLTQEWEVHVRGTDYPCIVRPILNPANVSSTREGANKFLI
ncbi:phage tail fiber protein [Klebsiella grimontii]|uniref:phage tail fiber protein n=1 Tax=Klebsiella grimontii TaxID=2058152 RepID=UPI003F88E494